MDELKKQYQSRRAPARVQDRAEAHFAAHAGRSMFGWSLAATAGAAAVAILLVFTSPATDDHPPELVMAPATLGEMIGGYTPAVQNVPAAIDMRAFDTARNGLTGMPTGPIPTLPASPRLTPANTDNSVQTIQ